MPIFSATDAAQFMVIGSKASRSGGTSKEKKFYPKRERRAFAFLLFHGLL